MGAGSCGNIVQPAYIYIYIYIDWKEQKVI